MCENNLYAASTPVGVDLQDRGSSPTEWRPTACRVKWWTATMCWRCTKRPAGAIAPGTRRAARADPAGVQDLSPGRPSRSDPLTYRTEEEERTGRNAIRSSGSAALVAEGIPGSDLDEIEQAYRMRWMTPSPSPRPARSPMLTRLYSMSFLARSSKHDTNEHCRGLAPGHTRRDAAG